MASQTVFSPTHTLPASITSPPTAQFTPGPGCVDPEDHWVVVTSCAAVALGENDSIHPSPDWLTCQFTQFGPPENGPASCYVPYSAQTVVDAETRFYSGCPSGYTGASTLSNSRSDGLETYFDVVCCPSQYNFNVDDYFTGGYMKFTTERDGVSYDVGYPLPGCATSHISELSGKDIAVQTQFNTYGWEKRQIANVPWDYLHGTMYAEVLSYRYTVFHGTHTCYQDCRGWHDYYFSGSSEPPFTVMNTVPVTTTPVEEPTTTALTSSEGETGIPPPVEEPDEPSIPPASVQSISSTTEDMPRLTSSIEQTPAPAPIPSGSNENTTSSFPSLPSSTTSDVPTGAAAVVTPTRIILIGLFLSVVAL
ncbi:hypothetical protein FHL15_004137 [Xylaria flabelliformis]|uniref:Uncharacterized protein n=1 Tax=Xylaria flabelliformis TaxID=2512241 RepID=A0A553I4C6_9PEZI|nr:hypothetical protein FHL15_004137 [Xylaria flabelliformis]